MLYGPLGSPYKNRYKNTIQVWEKVGYIWMKIFFLKGDLVGQNAMGKKTENPQLPGVMKLISMLFFGDIN